MFYSTWFSVVQKLLVSNKMFLLSIHFQTPLSGFISVKNKYWKVLRKRANENDDICLFPLDDIYT